MNLLDSVSFVLQLGLYQISMTDLVSCILFYLVIEYSGCVILFDVDLFTCEDKFSGAP